MTWWKLWLPVALGVAGIGLGIRLADQGRTEPAWAVLGASLILMGVGVGYWLHGHDSDGES